jgi:hypothetical protein
MKTNNEIIKEMSIIHGIDERTACESLAYFYRTYGGISGRIIHNKLYDLIRCSPLTVSEMIQFSIQFIKLEVPADIDIHFELAKKLSLVGVTPNVHISALEILVKQHS